MTACVNENCIGCGMCTSICPKVFSMTDENVAVANGEISLELEDMVQEAADSCPVGAIEVSVTLPKVPDTINMDLMTTEELHEKLQEGFDDIKTGNVQNASSAFAKFRENH